MPLNPLSPYALQKVVGEQYCRMFTQLYGLETVSIRYFNVFGPRQDPGSPYSGSDLVVLDRAPRRAGRRRSTATANRPRDFTYVTNVVDGVLRACDAPNVAGDAINVATGGRISLNELLRVMQKIVGTALQPEYAEARQGDVKDSQADITKARTLLGYEPTVDLEEGLRRTLDWFRRDRDDAR
jgi:UDP-glucose 4-epimerase